MIVTVSADARTLPFGPEQYNNINVTEYVPSYFYSRFSFRNIQKDTYTVLHIFRQVLFGAGN